jgi:tRNA A-37 threonylcarbamoyl transferase component Bud32
MVLREGAQKWAPASTIPELCEQETVAFASLPLPEETALSMKAAAGTDTIEESHARAPASPTAGDFPSLPGYEILAELGRGGMGVVYKARDRQLRHLVAIKLPLPHCVAREEDRERFLREARSAAGLRHPNICPIHRVDEFEGRPFIVLAYIEGEDLRAWMKRESRTARACAEIVAQLARAVAHAHQHGVIHRDIKPANTMIETGSNEPILMDFGLAKELGQQDSQLSHSGQILGTPAYMAPEQASGHLSQVGPLADVYSLGAVLYHMLCKRPPFEGNVGEIIRKVQTEEPTPPRTLVPSIHRDLETICLKALEKDPARRYESAKALAEDLERFAAGEAILARREGFLARSLRWVRRNRVATASVAATLVAIIIGAIVLSHMLEGNRLRQDEDAIRAELTTTTWTESSLGEIERRIDELEREVPGRGPALRGETHQAVLAWASAMVRQRAPLTEEQHEQIKTAIALLERRNPALAAELKSSYRDRQDTPDVVFELSPPYAHLSEVFGKERVSVHRDKKALITGVNPALTSVPSAGRLQVQAVFGPSWEQTREIGLLLNATRSGSNILGYSFVLLGPAADPTVGRKAQTFAEARPTDGVCVAQIRRHGVALRETPIAVRDLESGTLRLEAKRDRDRLTFQVNKLPPVEFRDLFPPSEVGVCGVAWPGGVLLESFTGIRRNLPEQASPLERGDDLYQRGQTAEALSWYREQARLSAGTEAGQEARVKEAIALMTLKRYDEAAPILESVSGEEGRTWPHVAASNLWLVRLRQKRFDDADLVLDNLLLRRQQGAFSDVSLTLPGEYTQEVLEVYMMRWKGIHMLRHDPNRIRHIERALQATELLGNNRFSWTLGQQARLRAYCVEGKSAQAWRIAQDLFQKAPVESRDALSLLGEYCVVARENGKAAEALREMDRRVLDRSGVPRRGTEWLLIERARR